MSQETLFIPASLQPHFDDEARSVHERWQGVTLDELIAGMPELQSYESSQGERIRYSDIVPSGEFDEENVVSLRLPIANGLRPHMLARARLLQDMLPVPQVVRIFPNDTKKQPTLDLTPESLTAIKGGDLSPLAELQQRSIERSFGDVSIDPSGYSFGGAVALWHALVGPARSLDFAEIPNVARRISKELDKDALNGEKSLATYNRAILHSDIPVLAEAFGTRRVRTSFKQIAVGGLLFWRDTRLPNNAVIKNALGYDTAATVLRDLAVKDNEVAVVSGRSTKGKLMPSAAGEYVESVVTSYFGNSEIHHIEEYAHEAGDNIWVPALLSRRARQLAIAAA